MLAKLVSLWIEPLYQFRLKRGRFFMNRRLFLYFIESFIVKTCFEPQLGVLPPSSKPFVKSFVYIMNRFIFLNRLVSRDSIQEKVFESLNRFSLLNRSKSFSLIPSLQSSLLNRIDSFYKKGLWRVLEPNRPKSFSLIPSHHESRFNQEESLDRLSCLIESMMPLLSFQGVSLYESIRVQPLGDIDDAFESLRPWLVSESKPLWPILIIFILKGSSIESIRSSLST